MYQVSSSSSSSPPPMEEVRNRIKILANTGIFGGAKLLKIKNDSDEGKGAQLMSEIMFFRLYLVDEGVTKEQTVLVKVQLKDSQRTADFSTDVQFANEVAMYGTILPELGASDIGVYPRMIYGYATNGKAIEEDIIVMEDLRASGYKIADNLFLDKDHVLLTMRKLGEYHGLSYKFKREFPRRFEELGEMLRSRKFKLADGLFEGAVYRGFASMIDNPVAEKAHKKLHDTCVNQKGNSLNYPEEPFALINHGDFNRNNLMYSYDVNGKVVDVKFIDLANSSYSDPATDISFFLYMNTTDQLRRAYWDEFLETYWEGVTSIVHPVFSYEEFLKHFAQRAIYGYIPCCFFLPVMMFPELLQEKDNREPDFEEKRKFGMTSGGEEATAAVTNITRHLLDMGYIKEFAENF